MPNEFSPYKFSLFDLLPNCGIVDGANLCAEKVCDIALQGGRKVSDSSDEEPHLNGKDLNNVEVRVLTELARGTTDTEVALKLFVYEDVVRGFYRSAIRKIGVRDHAEAMAWVKQHLVLS